MNPYSWEFLLYDETIPTVFGFHADMALLRHRKKIEKFRSSSEVMKNQNKGERENECTSSNGNEHYATAANPI